MLPTDSPYDETIKQWFQWVWELCFAKLLFGAMNRYWVQLLPVSLITVFWKLRDFRMTNCILPSLVKEVSHKFKNFKKFFVQKQAAEE